MTPPNDARNPSDDPEYREFVERRQRPMRIVAWVVIGALIVGGGGATVISLLFG